MQDNQKLAYKLIGLMSGTSLDGLDICLVAFYFENEKWQFDLQKTKSIAYSDVMLAQLKRAHQLSGLDLFQLDKEIGTFYAQSVNRFIAENKIDPQSIDAIASHGQTIFHQPAKGLTVQIGCGQTIHVQTGIPVINDFRKMDVLHGGQGAPLVPIGDLHLFSQFADSFLNIGGFANISRINGEDVTAFDVCPANIGINYFMRQLGKEYDFNGTVARSNAIDNTLLQQLNAIRTYNDDQPVSLGMEWVEETIFPIMQVPKVSLEVKIATLTEHAAIQIGKRLNAVDSKKVFVTGGGAKNGFLMERIQHHFRGELIVPSEELIDFKEALIFAFLGALNLANKPNCLPSVTGASKAVIGGIRIGC